VADAAFFVDAVRPQTTQRLRWDSGVNLIFPDRSEFFWARADGSGKGPKPVTGLAERRLDYNDLSLYTEGATGRIGIFTEVPYRTVDPEVDAHASGFGDMTVGTKTLLFDCELLQVGFEFKTYLMVGNARKGLGTGHVSLEPSGLLGIRLAEDTYLQTQFSEWIPIAGDPGYAGSIFHYHASINQVLCRILPNVPLIGTLEFNGWSFQHGQYTDPINGAFQGSSGDTYLSFGPGLRLVVCDKIDFGFGTAFALTHGHWADQLYRTEFRWRY
jgi:hypothetical protein